MRSMLAPAGVRFLHMAPRTAGLPPPLAALVQCACTLLAALAAAAVGAAGVAHAFYLAYASAHAKKE